MDICLMNMKYYIKCLSIYNLPLIALNFFSYIKFLLFSIIFLIKIYIFIIIFFFVIFQ